MLRYRNTALENGSLPADASVVQGFSPTIAPRTDGSGGDKPLVDELLNTVVKLEDEKAVLVDEVETLRRQVDSIYRDQRRGYVTAAFHDTTDAGARQKDVQLRTQVEAAERLCGLIEDGVAAEVPQLLPVVSQLRKAVHGIVYGAQAAHDRNSALLHAWRSATGTGRA